MSNVAKSESPKDSPSLRFLTSVIGQFESNSGEVELTSQMKRTLQNYFVKLDSILKDNESKRLRTPEQKRDPLEFSWKNVNMEKLAQECISFAMLGLDPLISNHLNLIPYKNSGTNKFDVGFIKGYKGIQLIATKFGLDVPEDVVIELVYSNDEFKIIKKDYSNKIETYELNILNPFDRGEIVGGFYYMSFKDSSRNFIREMSLKAIEKRKPKYASAEFWGGEKDVWSNGKKAGKETIEGWFDEMCYKTIVRSAYESITIDGTKINDHYVKALSVESTFNEPISTRETVASEIDQYANDEEISFDVIEDKKEVIEPIEKPTKAVSEMEFPASN